MTNSELAATHETNVQGLYRSLENRSVGCELAIGEDGVFTLSRTTLLNSTLDHGILTETNDTRNFFFKKSDGDSLGILSRSNPGLLYLHSLDPNFSNELFVIVK